MQNHDRVLIVDDSTALRMAFSQYLANLGYDAVCASDESEVLSALYKCNYSIAFVDWFLGNQNRQDGFDVIRMLRRVSPVTRRFLITGYATDELECSAKSLVEGVLEKPIEPHKLINIIRASARFPTERTVHLKVLDNDLELRGKTINLSSSGALISVDALPNYGSSVTLDIQSQDEEGIQTVGEVVRHQRHGRKSCIGVKFTTFSTGSRDRLMRLIASESDRSA